MSDERDVQEVMARYVRAADRGDGKALSGLFMPDGCVELFTDQGGRPVPVGKLDGHARIASGLAGSEDRNRQEGWRHHATHDAIVSMHGDKATIDVGFIVHGHVRGDGLAGIAADGRATMRIVVIDAGFYHANLKRHDGAWRISALRITSTGL